MVTLTFQRCSRCVGRFSRMDGFDFGAEATPDDAAGMNGHVEDDPDAGALGGFDIADSGAAPAAPEAASPPAAAGTSVPFGADFGGSVETPQSTRDAGSHSFADVPMGGSSFNPKLTCVDSALCFARVASAVSPFSPRQRASREPLG